jgi:hypothetical protein
LAQDVQEEIDRAVARRFTLYGEDARTNGYDFQAYLIEKKVLPQIKASLDEVVKEQRSVEAATPARVKKLATDSAAWKQRARLVGMVAEYDFIYSYTSRLLHATPASITTNQKNLEGDEMAMFLRYARVRILDLIEIGTSMVVEARKPFSPNPPIQ